MQLSSLKKLIKETISDIDLFFSQDVSESETKALLASDLAKYVLTSSGLYTDLKTGSFSGEFLGNHYGKSTNSTSSVLSRHSIYSNYLNYPNNSTSSYSITSISSSYSISSSNNLSSSYSTLSNLSTTSSHVDVLIYKSSQYTNTSSNSSIAGYSNSADYLIFDGSYNGKVYKSILSDNSVSSSYAKQLIENGIIKKSNSEYENDPAVSQTGVVVNFSTSSYSISSSISDNSITADYIKNVEYAIKSKFAENSDNTIFAYVNFDIIITGSVINNIPVIKYNFNVNQYKNIAEPGIGVAHTSSNMIIFTGSYYTPPVPINNNTDLQSTTVLSEIALNGFPMYTPTSFFYRSYGFPIGNDKFGIALRVGSVADGDPTNAYNGVLIGSNISAVMLANTIGEPTPNKIPATETVNTSNLIQGCAKL